MTLQEHLHARSNRLSLEYKLYHRLGNAGKHDVISKDNSNNNTVIVLILQQCNFVASLLVAVGWLNKIIYLWLSDWVAANQLHRESKKEDIKLLAITSLTIIRFSIFFHC